MKKRSLGVSFSDELVKVNIKHGNFKKPVNEEWKDSLLPNFSSVDEGDVINLWRVTILSAVSIVLFFLIFLKVFRLQIVDGAKNRQLADGNRIQIKIIHAPRGVIFDRNGKILASNVPGFRLVDDKKITYITRDQALEFEAKGDVRLKNLEVDSIRSYPMAEISSHILGYVSEITSNELENFAGYRTGDRIGRGGVEESYESFLKGVDGGEVIEVDAAGNVLRVLRKVEPIPGKNLYLTIDSSLQEITFKTLESAVKKTGSCCGAAIVSDPKIGDILALVSYPSFDPENIGMFLNAANSPLLNRAIAGTYPPGSTFKLASSLAGLTSGKISKDTTYEDTGQIYIGPYKFTNWHFTQYGKTEGSVNLIKAIKRSNDTYFYFLAQAVGESILSETAKKLGFGKTLGIDIPGEVSGLIPGNDWKVKEKGEVWFPGDTLHMSIGQGFVLSTPLQVLNLTSTVAASGKQYKPHLALKITGVEGKFIKEFEFESKDLGFKKEDMEIVKQGMEEANASGGTAWSFFNFPIPSAGKTGTAEYGDSRKTHAWYTAFAPSDDPKIAAVVLVEGGGEGSSVAAPIVKEIFRWFLSEDKSNLIKDIGQIATDSARQLGE